MLRCFYRNFQIHQAECFFRIKVFGTVFRTDQAKTSSSLHRVMIFGLTSVRFHAYFLDMEINWAAI